MEAFSLLNFWRKVGGEDAVGFSDADLTNTSREATTANNHRDQAAKTDDETDEEDSFFDLEFTVPDCDEKEGNDAKNVCINSSIEEDEDLNKCKFVECSNDVFFERRNSKPQTPISLLKSPPKSGASKLGFENSKLAKTMTNRVSMANPKHHQQSNRFAAKCEVEEVSIRALFTRENSLRSKMGKQSSEDASSDDSTKRFPKHVVHKYLKLIKPLYVRVSKRYGEKMKFPNHSSTTPSSSPATAPMCSPRKQVDEKQSSRAAALRVVCKHLGKSRSASAAVGIVPSPANRRDDSLLQQHDGIQSAILHCKRSFNSSRESSLLSRSASETCHEKSTSPSRKSSKEQKQRCSI